MLPINRNSVNQTPAFQPRKLADLSIQKIRRTLEHGCSESWLNNKTFINFMLYLLHCDGKESLQMEASWIFTNIAAGPDEQTKMIVDCGVVQPTMKLLSSPSNDVVEQAIWTLSNVIGDNTEFRDMLIAHGIIDSLLALEIETKSASFLRTFIWVIVNLVRCKNPQISVENAQKLIPRINAVFRNVDTTAKIDALWALTYIADCGEEYIQLIIDTNIISAVVPLLSNHRFKIQIAAMRMLGNIATGTDEQTNVLLANDLLIHIRFPLMNPKENLRRMALWCMSNITVGTQEQVQAVFMSGLLNRIVEGLSLPDLKSKREALYTINNMINFGSQEQVMEIIDCGAVRLLFPLLNVNEDQIATIARNSLKTLFSKASELVDKYFDIYARLRSS